MICGIYKIINKVNGKIYIGSSKNMKKRFYGHRFRLNKKIHHSLYLQNAWNKYGSDNFEFIIIEECEESKLFEREQYWIDNLQPQYNVGSVGGGDNISKHPNLEAIRKKHSENGKKIRDSLTSEERKTRWGKPMESNPNWRGGTTKKTCIKCGTKIVPSATTCIKCKENSGINNPFYGKHHTQETKDKVRQTRLSRKYDKPKNAHRMLIDGVIYESQADAAKALGVSIGTISWRTRQGWPNYIILPRLSSLKQDEIDSQPIHNPDESNQK